MDRSSCMGMQVSRKEHQITDIQNWIDNLDPMLAFLVMGGLFLVCSISGWYVGNVLLQIKKGLER
jgi:hypothetical protein